MAKQLKFGAGVWRTRSFIAALCRRSVVILTVTPVFFLLLARNTAAGDESGIPKPSSKISLEPLGYAGLSAGARQSGGSNVSLDFLDSQHVLATFNPKKLFKRLPDCPPTHADRLVHAVVLEVPSGKVVKEKDWYLHDLRRYVWNLGGGRVLLRRLNRLYEVDSNLEEKLVFDSPKDLLWVTVTSDEKQIVVETSAATGAAEDPREGKLKDEKKKERVQLTFLDAHSLLPQRTIEVRGRIKLEATSSGFAEVRRLGGAWLVAFHDTAIARVKSRPVPDLLYSSGNSVLIGRCAVSRSGYNMSAFTLSGSFLWRQHWDECRFSPVARTSEEGSRFAAGTVSVRRVPKVPENEANESAEEGLLQHVQVLDTATGNSMLSITASPAVLDGQNFSLSPEGTRLAVIVGSAIELYDLPEMSSEDRARWVAVKADTPNLNAPPKQAAKPGEEPIYSSASDEETSEEKLPQQEASRPADSGTPANAPAAEPTPTLVLKTGTQVVAVDVVVTDSGGHPVKGLAQSDFRVLEDGKPQTIRYFQEMAEANRPAISVPPPPQALPPNVFSNYTASTEEEHAVTVVLLDLLNTPMTDQSYAQDQLIKFLKKKPKDAKFAICILGNRLQMIQGFTEDQATLLAAAKGKKASQRNRPIWDSQGVTQTSLQGNRASTRFQPMLDSFAASVALQQSELRLVDADQRMEVTVDAFAHLARYLTGIPGRKNLIWLSGSFVLGIYPDSNGNNPFLGTRHYGENLKKVANLLGEAHVAVYPVDVKGLEANPLFSAANGGAESAFSSQGSFRSRSSPALGAVPGGSAVFSPNPNIAAPADALGDEIAQFDVAQSDEHATMAELAAQTGGKAFYNTNGIAEAIQAAAEQGSNYYALSYTPINKNYDGRYRRVKVTFSGKKYHLAYREGYYAINPFAPVRPSKDLTSSLARAAMQSGSPQSHQIVFGARVVPVGKPRVVQDSAMAVKSTKKHKEQQPETVEVQRYAIDHAVTSSDLRYTQGTDGIYHDMLNFMVTAFDEDGKLMASQVAQTSSDLKPEAFKEVMIGGLRMHQEIEVPVKCVNLRLGVEDVGNGHIGTLEIRLPVPAPPEVHEAGRRLPPVEPD